MDDVGLVEGEESSASTSRNKFEGDFIPSNGTCYCPVITKQLDTLSTGRSDAFTACDGAVVSFQNGRRRVRVSLNLNTVTGVRCVPLILPSVYPERFFAEMPAVCLQSTTFNNDSDPLHLVAPEKAPSGSRPSFVLAIVGSTRQRAQRDLLD
jgi:hypothetical protein